MADLDPRDELVGVDAPTALIPEVTRGTTRRRIRDLLSLAFARAAPGLNYGDDPWKPHPVPETPFNAAKTALIHFFFDEGLELHVLRVHFEAVTGGANEWSDNESRVRDWVNYLNSLAPLQLPDPRTAPTAFDAWLGLDDFAFNQQHHAVFYVKNRGISYDRDFPVWFSDSLQDNVFGVRVASANKSFYEAEVYNVAGITGGFSSTLIHMKNYYQLYRGGAYGSIMNGQDRLAYAININAAAPLSIGGWALPIIIDPDTGNMGEGQP
jgi:hypothetical protein